jgi:RING finger and CHY zinc finger domain-containing protein 1
MRQNCPICYEYLFDSVQPTAVMPCGHTIHSSCFRDLQSNHQTSCPICLRSYGNMASVWERIDLEVLQTPMPPDYANWKVGVGFSRARFHALMLWWHGKVPVRLTLCVAARLWPSL